VAICAVPPAHAGLVSSSADESLFGVSLRFGSGGGVLPITGDVTGVTFGEAAAGTTPATAIATELRPSAGPGAILTAGPPPVGGTVSYPLTTNTHSNLVGSATATTSALIRGIPTGPGGGVVNMVSIVAVTSTSATASGIAFAAATAEARDPFTLAPLASDTPAVLTVDLALDPTHPLELGASESGAGDAMSDFHIDAASDIPGLSSLFSLDLTDVAGGSGVGIDFTSPLVSDPLAESDFTPLGGGEFELGAAFEEFTIPFTIPAGTLAIDPTLGPVGLELDTTVSSASVAAIPESASLLSLAVGFGVMALFARRGGRRAVG
jgi:hypothetical protein